MVYSRVKALDWLESVIIKSGPFEGLVLEKETDFDVYVFNQCALTATALKQGGRSSYTKVANAVNSTLDKYQDKINQNPIRDYLYPILDPSIIPVAPSFNSNNQAVLYQGSGTSTDPSNIFCHREAEYDFSKPCSSLPSNRALARCIYHFNKGETTTARGCWDYVMNQCRPEGFAIADPGDKKPEGYRYSTYKTMLQWIAAKKTGFGLKVLPDFLDRMQQPNGKVAQFTQNNYKDIREGNSETTALSIIADVAWSNFSCIVKMVNGIKRWSCTSPDRTRTWLAGPDYKYNGMLAKDV